MSEKTEMNPRYDFSDMILGGGSGKTVFIKNLHPASDLLTRPDIYSAIIWRKCVDAAYDGNYKETENGPAGEPVLRDFAYEHLDYELEQVVRFRVSVQISTKGVFFCLRRITGKIPLLSEQGFTQPIIDRLLKNGRRGLVLFGGEMGSGKTTAASATISEWLKKNGGSAITLEDPPEYALQGPHVDKETYPNSEGGLCIQRATTPEKMAAEIPTLMRAAAPEIIFLGEIREEKVAREAVLAASNGHLVLSTIHGKGIEGAITRLISLGASSSMSYENTSKTVANALSMVIFQKLVRSPGSKVLQTIMADFMDKDRGTAMRHNIAEMHIEQISGNLIAEQERSLI